jgi:hypothetical protein
MRGSIQRATISNANSAQKSPLPESHYRWEGKSMAFSNQYQGKMYSDCTIGTASLKQERLIKRMELLKIKE